MARSNMENATILDFTESIEYFGLKIGNKNCLNEYTNIYEKMTSRPLFDL